MAGNGVKSWSFSRWNDYKRCPAAFKFKVIDRLKEPPNSAMERGLAIHKLAEDYTKGIIKTLPPELTLFKAEFAALKKQKYKVVEDSWNWTANWASETFAQDWNNAWLRVKLDVGYTNPKHMAFVPIDHKTGKPRPEKTAEYEAQMELYALAAFMKLPDIQIVAPQLWYLDTGEVYTGPDPENPVEYTRAADAKRLEKVWNIRIKPMFTDTAFKPTPGDACRWCHFRKSNNGPCKF